MMIIWINGPYGVGKSALAKELLEHGPKGFLFDAEEVGNAVRDNMPKELFNGYLFENYPLWFDMCTTLLKDISNRYDGLIYVPMTLTLPDSFEKFAQPLKENGIVVKHILLESTFEIVHDRILARGEEEDCWCMQHIDFCLEQQRTFENAVRIQSVGETVSALAVSVRKALNI